MLNDLLKRSGVEKLLPCTEYILQRSDRRRVHLVGDLPKPLLNSPTDLLAAFNPRLPGKLRQAGGNDWDEKASDGCGAGTRFGSLANIFPGTFRTGLRWPDIGESEWASAGRGD
jgi:hypothetical protein